MLFKIFGLAFYFLCLLGYTVFCLLRGYYIRPDSVKCVHVERQVIQFSVKICDRGVGKAIEFCEFIHEIPNISIISTKDVRTVYVNIYIMYIFGIAVSCDVVSFFND
jgi:hypothetical protein